MQDGLLSLLRRTKIFAVLTAVQNHSLRHIWDTLLEFLEFEDFEVSIDELKTELLSKIVHYSGKVVSVRRQLTHLFKGLACVA